jgi:hypothetical protein
LWWSNSPRRESGKTTTSWDALQLAGEPRGVRRWKNSPNHVRTQRHFSGAIWLLALSCVSGESKKGGAGQVSRLERSLNKPVVVLVVGVVAVALNVLLYFGYFLPKMKPIIGNINPIGISLPEAISKSVPETGSNSDPQAGGKSDSESGGTSGPDGGGGSDSGGTLESVSDPSTASPSASPTASSSASASSSPSSSPSSSASGSTAASPQPQQQSASPPEASSTQEESSSTQQQSSSPPASSPPAAPPPPESSPAEVQYQ